MFLHRNLAIKLEINEETCFHLRWHPDADRHRWFWRGFLRSSNSHHHRSSTMQLLGDSSRVSRCVGPSAGAILMPLMHRLRSHRISLVSDYWSVETSKIQSSSSEEPPMTRVKEALLNSLTIEINNDWMRSNELSLQVIFAINECHDALLRTNLCVDQC